MKIEFNKEKFKSVVHYAISKAEKSNCHIGATQLNKILWYADACHFLRTGKSITGEIYIKQEFGPVPKRILSINKELLKDKQITENQIMYWGKLKREFKSTSEPNITNLDSLELSILNENIEFVSQKTAKEISDLTHTECWSLAELGEEIPLCAIFAENRGEITDADIQWAKEQIHAK